VVEILSKKKSGRNNSKIKQKEREWNQEIRLLKQVEQSMTFDLTSHGLMDCLLAYFFKFSVFLF
jgi:hypothetical protein